MHAKSPELRMTAGLLFGLAFGCVSLAAWAGAATGFPAYTVGDRWSYREIEGYSRLALRTRTREVTSAGAGDIRISGAANGEPERWRFSDPGTLASGPLSDRAAGELHPRLQLLAFPLEPGKRWEQTVTRTDPATGAVRSVTLRGKVLDWEVIRVPAGEFRALKIERRITLGDYDTFRTETWRTEYEWYVPELKGAAKIEIWEQYWDPTLPRPMRYLLNDRRFLELVSYRPGAH